ncbi:ABC transporter ATP-binding protein, partial [bacterium]|nr:ABC transporter ATP-binding protein [bacterium]
WLVDTLGGETPAVLTTLESWGFADPHAAALWLLPTAMAGVMFAGGFFSFLGIYASARIGLDLTARVRRACMERVLGVPYSDFTRSKTGELLSRVHENTQGFNEATMTLREVVRNALTVLIVGTVVILRHWQLGLYLVAVFVLLGLSVAFFNRHQRRYAERVADTSARIYGYAGERLSAVEIVTAYGAAGRESVRFKELAYRYFRNRLKGEMVTSAFRGLVQLLAGAGLMGMLIYGAGLVRGGAMTTGSLFELLGLVAVAFEPLKSLSRARLRLAPAGIQIGRVAAVLRWPIGGAPEELPLGKVKLKVLPNPRLLDGPREGRKLAEMTVEIEGELSFEGVSYRVGGELILEKVSFIAPKGRVTAIVGPSGAGKSTILNLALGLLEPTEGRVLLDERPRNGYDQAVLARLQALVPQEITLTAGSVAENLRLAKPTAGVGELWEKLELAQVDDVVKRLPDGIESEVGERGGQLSGGEGQRLAIARALLRDPQILALDEPTANLDSESEDRINAALTRALPGRTVLVVAHRLSTVRNADRIIFIEDGRVIERGTHEELMAKNGRYAEMARLQSAEKR